jgi:superfamily I DNA and/or RNA helicase
MGKSVYRYYKNRLIEIGGNNKCLYLKSVARKSSYDVGRIIEGRDKKLSEFTEFLWSKSKRQFTLISNKEKSEILENLEIETRIFKSHDENAPLSEKDIEKLRLLEQKHKRAAVARAMETELTRLKELKREVEEIERETGRYELYIGYPFVFGSITQGFHKTPIKAPLLLFPVKIELPDENTVNIVFNEAAKIHINPALIFAYSQAKRLSVEELELELDDMSAFKNLEELIRYLNRANIKIDYIGSKNIYCYSKFKDPQDRDLSIRYAAVMARFPLTNSIYNDYSLLEKKKLTNDAINELLLMGRGAKKKLKKKPKSAKLTKEKHNYTVKMLDYAQLDVVKKSDEKGNMVIYGPPGTGKSQTIVNVISDAMCKGKRVLVVSQKKAALDVVYNRLAALNEKAIYVSDECKEKQSFYSTALLAHNRALEDAELDIREYENKYRELEEKIAVEERKLSNLSEVMNERRPYGLSLLEMYSSSYNFAKNTTEYELYRKMLEGGTLLSLNHAQITDAVFRINSDELGKTYYDYAERKRKNPLIDCVYSDLDLCTLGEAKGELETLMHYTKRKFFNLAEHPMYSRVLAFYGDCGDEAKIDRIIKMEIRGIFKSRKRAQMKAEFMRTLFAIDEFAKDYVFLAKIFKKEGYVSIIDNLVRGNFAYLKNVYSVLTNYTAERDTARLISTLPFPTLAVLEFAYANSKSFQSFSDTVEKIPIVRIYHEIIYFEECCKNTLAETADFQNITSRIYKMREMQLEISEKLTFIKVSKAYKTAFETGKDSKNFFYQISKTQKFWPIRRLMESFGDYLLKLFPCWMLSPENVSNLLPLEKNLFDTVIFDEASQVFIESTLPTIYRGKTIVVAGDAKQLRPSTTFMKRYLGADPELIDDLSMQAALEVESLLDLAVSRYTSSNLTYHYRSRYSELIDFSNNAFYNGSLKIAPNISKNKNVRPIERHKVNGSWIDRTNPVEARRVVEIIRELLISRKNNESIGVITFNSDQQSCIADEIDKECRVNPDFRTHYENERHRIENGEDTSIFIKNLENVQGDERDIIIFSIGYAKNPEGKISSIFGSLSAEGGENRLNVAITRAKTKIIVVTSIEPEELKVDDAKNLGPRLLKRYLAYVRSVSEGNEKETQLILSDIGHAEIKPKKVFTNIKGVDERIKERLEKLGYSVELQLGNSKNKISLAIYDAKEDKYSAGVQLDCDVYYSSDSVLERDVYNPRFLQSRGWSIIRVFCRDFWLSPQKVIKRITEFIQKGEEK